VTLALAGYGTTNVFVGIVVYAALFLLTIGKFRTKRSVVIGLVTVALIPGFFLLTNLDESVPGWMRLILASVFGLTGSTFVGFIAADAWRSSQGKGTGGS